MLVCFLVAIVAIALVGYEYFVANSISGYTKVSVTFAQTCSVKFGDTSAYNLTFLPLLPDPDISWGSSPTQGTTIQVSEGNSTKYFDPNDGARYTFSGLQIVVGNANFKQVDSNRQVYLSLYVKSSITNSKPIISLTPYSGTN